jgi:uncharacterized cupredoxin-like copper-binding protein
MRLLLVTAAAVLVLGACGGGGGGGSSGGGGNRVTMSDFKFSPNSLQLKSGSVTLNLVNNGSQQHDMVVEDKSGKVIARSPQIGAGDSTAFTISNLPAGDYTFFCDLPGHKEAGMTGKLTAAA